MTDISSSMENLKCPVCLEIPPENVFQCHRGHIVCAQCETKLNTCPVCKAPYGEDKKIRNLQIENVLDSMKFPCPNKDEGCDEVLSRKMILQHQDTCKFVAKSMSICKMIGYNCSFRVTSKEPMNSLESHLQSKHQIFVHQGSDLQLAQEYCQSRSLIRKHVQKNMIWKPVVIHFDGTMFLVLSYVDGTKKSLCWICLNIATPQEKENEVKYHAELSISRRDQIEDLEWRQNCVNCFQAEVILSTKPFQMPLSLLQENYMEDGRLTVKLCLRKDSFRMPSINAEDQVTSLITIGSPEEVDIDNEENSLIGDEGHDTIFEDCFCDICAKQPIKGILFWCMQCAAFCLCQDCFSPSTHPFHVFAMIRTEDQFKVVAKVLISRIQRDAISSNDDVITERLMKAVLPGGDDVDAPSIYTWVNRKNKAVFETTQCDGCQRMPIVGARFKCLQCDNYDLCESCVEAGFHSNHVFVIITNPFQNEFINEEAMKRSPIIHIPKITFAD